jgi:DNA replication ATP-dependent helicase Dna2
MLSTQRPEAVVDLRYQYRMNEDIMSLSNTLIYDGRLRVGNEVVGKRGLKLPSKRDCVGIKGAEAGCKGLESCWAQDLLDERSVLLISPMPR